MKIDRRHLLGGGAAYGAAKALEATGAFADKKGPTSEELGERIEYFHHATEGFKTDSQGNTTFTTRLKEGDIYVFLTQKLGLPDTGQVYEVDSLNHPDQSMVVAVIAHKVITPESVNNFQFITYFNRYVWKTRERSKSITHARRVEDGVRAGEVQVSRSRIPGNCTVDGCQKTRLVVLLAHEVMGTDGKTSMKFDEAVNEMYEK